jgi:hypothetical protein
MNGAAHQLAMFTGAVRDQLWDAGAELEVAYIGGVFESEMLLARFRILVEMTEGARVIAPHRNPAEGALLEAIRNAS